MAIKKVESDVKKKKKEESKLPKIGFEEQLRLAEILNDSPRLESLNGTVWEIRALRLGTQHLIAEEAIKVKILENASFGDVLKELATCIPNVLNMITLALLNDRNKIFKNGNPREGYSDLFHSTRETLEWDCNVSEFGNILVDVMKMLDVGFFFATKDMLEMIRQMTTEMKRMRIKGQK